MKQKGLKELSFGEILFIMSVLAILLAFLLLAINPAGQFSQANNSKRRDDVNAILTAIREYEKNNKFLPSVITLNQQEISNSGINICAFLVPSYLLALPVDPSIKNGVSTANCRQPYNTGYIVSKNLLNQVTVTAPKAEAGEIISATR